MRDVAVGFLWHMHQPYYKDPVSCNFLLPWVRLHSIRGYYDMIAVLEDYPKISCTFNLVPSLLSQIIDYTDNAMRDSDYYLSMKRPSDLSLDEKKQIISNFFMCNLQTMIAPFPRYMNLYEKRGHLKDPKSLDKVAKAFSNQDILDLQVLFNLAWTGFMARKDERVSELIKKGRSYTESDKGFLLDYHIEIMKRLIPMYKKALDEDRIEITASPFYHPIGPLLMNVGYALRSMDTPLPSEAFSHPEDLDAQIKGAIEFHEDIFGVKPRGMWPSEGSVCPEMIELFASNGIIWSASDEDILIGSLRQPRTGSRLYKPYRVTFGEDAVSMFFRDRPLSDHIGFVYSKNPSGHAVNDFMHHLGNIHRGAKAYDFEPFVSVILDGENPWEYYSDGGEGFLRGLYERLSSCPGIYTSRFGRYLEKSPPRDSLSNLFTGSWINHNFAIWIGHEEDRKAWEYLSRTRAYLESKGEDADKLAWEEIYTAEGSDWFWWYGDEFSSENDEDFDRLFRVHLKNCYTLHDDNPPKDLSQSIITPHDVIPLKMPVGFIYPIIDGKVSHFYEWRKAGFYVASSSSSSMYKHGQLLSYVYFGFDLEHLYMRLDFNTQLNDVAIHVRFISPEPLLITISTDSDMMGLYRISNGNQDKIADLDTFVYDSVLEIKVPFSMLGASSLQRMRFFIALMERDLEVERHPASGLLSFTVPDKGFERVMWYV